MTIFEGRNQIAYSYGRFGYTRNSGKTWHGGIDVVGVDSSMIRAVVAGIVVFSGIVTNKTDRTWEWGYFRAMTAASITTVTWHRPRW